jgi:hypothetical protein
MKINHLFFTNVDTALGVSIVSTLILCFEFFVNRLVTWLKNVLFDLVLEATVFPCSIFEAYPTAR